MTSVLPELRVSARPAASATPRVVAVPRSHPSPALRALATIHSSAAHGYTLAVDIAVVALAARALGAPLELLGSLALIVPVGLMTGLYRRRSSIEAQGALWYAKALALPAALTGTFILMLRLGHLGSARPLETLGSVVGALVMVRIASWLVLARARRQGAGLLPTLVSGPAAAVAQLTRRVNAFPECGLHVVAEHTPLDALERRFSAEQAAPAAGLPRSRAVDLVTTKAVDAVLIVASTSDQGACEQLIRAGDGTGIDFNVVLPFAGLASPFRPRIGDFRVVPLGAIKYAASRHPSKRAFDIVAAAAMLFVLAPALALIAAAVKLGSRGPVFYGQSRVGRNGRPFKMWKFRSMVPGADNLVELHLDRNISDGLLVKIVDDPRITPIGHILRRLSLDELPQLFNVLRGEMSFVGPRPLPVDPDEFAPGAAKRHAVRPGITGPWQVHGGHALSYDDMVGLDLAYVNGWSFRHDLWLLMLTIPALLVRRAPVI